MMTLARICGEHRHAVERDLIALRFNGLEDLGNTPKLTVFKLVSIVCASPPGTAVYHAETRGNTPLSPEAQFLANLSEQQAGLLDLNARYQLPGVNSMPVNLPQFKASSFASLPDYQGLKLEALPVDEMISKREELAQTARANAGKVKDRVVLEKYDAHGRPVNHGL
jgi:hypothetical protein